MSIFAGLARHVSVGDLQTRLGPTLEWQMSREEAIERLEGAQDVEMPYYLDDWGGAEVLCLVRDDSGEVSHFVWGLDVRDGPVASVARPILPARCVAATTPAISLMRVFARDPWRERWRLVLDETTLTGVVSDNELLRPELAICVLALLLEVERRCAEAVTWEPDDTSIALAKLSANRLLKAKEIYLTRYKCEPSDLDHEMVFCTTFADKGTMVVGLPAFSDLSRGALKKRFKLMEDARNRLAHVSTRGQELEWLFEVVEVAEDTLERLAPHNDQPPIRLVVSNPH